MKVQELLLEGWLDTLKSKLGAVAGKIVGSVESLLQLFKKNPNLRLTTIESFKVRELSKEFEARVDTGALVCSLHAEELVVNDKKVSFKLNGQSHTFPLLREKEVRNANGSAIRPRVALTFEWNGKIYQNVETSLTDRSKMKFQLLIGRNLISDLKLPVYINNRDAGENRDM